MWLRLSIAAGAMLTAPAFASGQTVAPRVAASLTVLSLGALPTEVPAPQPGFSFADGLRIADKHRVAAVATRRIRYLDYWRAIAPFLRSNRFTVEPIGRSMQGREIRSISFGSGSTTVLLWSQMHGNEATSTMALADIFAWLAAPGADPIRDRLAGRLKIVFVPMLNPDGAERFQRENAGGVDINRDARRLSTPEARALKGAHDRYRPAFGFNLHDQNARTRVGKTGPQAAIALLAPPTDVERSWGPVRSKARLVAAGLARGFATEIPDRVSRYDDAFNPRAFGDLMQTWGTSTVLIESGALPGDPDKQKLRRLHVAAIVGALDAIATGGFERADPDDYERLPFNLGGGYDVLVRGGQLVIPGAAPFRADVAINYDEPVARTSPRLREVGDLEGAVAVDTVDADGLFLHPAAPGLTRQGNRTWWPIGATAALDLRTSAAPSSTLRRRIR